MQCLQIEWLRSELHNKQVLQFDRDQLHLEVVKGRLDNKLLLNGIINV